MQTKILTHSPTRTTVDDVAFSLTLSIFAASLAVLLA